VAKPTRRCQRQADDTNINWDQTAAEPLSNPITAMGEAREDPPPTSSTAQTRCHNLRSPVYLVAFAACCDFYFWVV